MDRDVAKDAQYCVIPRSDTGHNSIESLQLSDVGIVSADMGTREQPERPLRRGLGDQHTLIRKYRGFPLY